MKQENKFKSEQQQEVAAQQQSTQNTAQEFRTVEELLRFDAAHTPTPPAVAERLQKSSAQIPKPPPPSWWQRLFK
ncbi:MAG TPA: hypothetical protein VN761_07470 [Candidatus Polarisedimenticolia bacterium]|nr:hypothetical protein [Candidatus Polarisedimenticolia bacterium]